MKLEELEATTTVRKLLPAWCHRGGCDDHLGAVEDDSFIEHYTDLRRRVVEGEMTEEEYERQWFLYCIENGEAYSA